MAARLVRACRLKQSNQADTEFHGSWHGKQIYQLQAFWP